MVDPVDDRLIRQFINSNTRRKKLHSSNTNPNYDEFESKLRAKKLDSTLRKCNAFVKRMRNYSGQQISAEQEVESLNLTKYLSEICSAIAENRYKESSHIWEILSIASKLHQRYQDFSSTMLDIYKSKFTSKPNDIDWNTASTDLRLLTEFVICGILGDEGYPIILTCLKQIIVADKEKGDHMAVILSFAKEFGLEAAGIQPKGFEAQCEKLSVPVPSSDLLHPQKRLKIKFLLTEYMNNVNSNLLKLHEELNNSALVCRKQLKTKGEVHKDRSEIHKELSSNFEKFHVLAKKLSYYTNVDLPELPELPPDDEEEESDLACENIELEGIPRSSFFEDEETRSFYQDLPDLTRYLTSAAKRENVLILEQQAAALRQAEESLDEDLELAELESDAPVQVASEEIDLEPESDATTKSNDNGVVQDEDKSEYVPPKYNEYLKSLLNCVNRNMIDDAAELFISNFNNKTNRKKLIKHLTSIPRQRLDLLPLWSRYIAILYPVVPDVGSEVIEFLKKELRFLLRRCHPTFVETKLKITKYIAELVNFEVFPPIDAFTCLRILLVNFTQHQIEMACAFVEGCGKYLYKNPATRRRMKIYIDQMMRKKQAKVMSPHHANLVDQAYYAVFPPETTVKKKTISGMECYLEILVYGALVPKISIKAITTKLRKLKWDDPKTFNTALKIFCRPWLMSIENFKITCSVLSELSYRHPKFGAAVSDTLITFMVEGLSYNNALNNQHLIITLSYICELFRFQYFIPDTILKLMYAFIMQGVSMDYNRVSFVDPPKSTFRLRLVTVLLKGCGDFMLIEKHNKKKLKSFLIYLQRYMYFKLEHPVWNSGSPPYLYEPFHIVEDLVRHLFPKMKMLKTYELACEAVNKLEAKIARQYKVTIPSFPPPQSTEHEHDTNLNSNLENIVEEDDSESVRTNTSSTESLRKVSRNCITPTFGFRDYTDHFGPTTYSGAAGGNGGTGDWIIDTNEEELACGEKDFVKVTVQEVSEFDRQLDRMMSEASHVGQREARHINTDIRIPMNLQKKPNEEKEEQPEGTIPYALLLKKGNKANIKHVDVPENAEFVKRMRRREAAEREERAQLKERTLRINQLQMDEEMEQRRIELQNNLARFQPKQQVRSSQYY